MAAGVITIKYQITMKRTFMITTLAAALMGGQVFAATVIPTEVTGKPYGKWVDSNAWFCGAYSGTDQEAKNGTVNVTAAKSGGDSYAADHRVCGGGSRSGDANNNAAIMEGGQVGYLIGGAVATGKTSSDNVVVMAGGTAQYVYGGYSALNTNKATINTNNKVHLVGVGYTGTLTLPNDSHGNAQSVTVTGSALSITKIVGAGNNYTGSTNTNNTLDIYGTNITVAQIVATTTLSFHITDGLATAEAPMLNYTATVKSQALTFHDKDNKKVAGGCEFIATEVTDWSAFAGKSITLVQAVKEIQGLTEDDLKEGGVVLTGADGKTATATLVLSDDHTALSLKIAEAPEPTTGALSLLALGLLAGRRRK